MGKLQHYQKYQRRYVIAILCGYFFINNTLLATSVIMEAKRHGDVLPFALWEPFVWEYSSAVGALLMFPVMIWLLDRHPFNWQAIPRSVLHHFVGSLVFSAGHISIMLAIREAIYAMQGWNYDFGDVGFELLYEYRKDLWSYIFFVIAILTYRFVLSRLQGEANPIQEGEPVQASGDSPLLDRLLVKKLGKEFIIRVDDVEWLESSGNYVNLHIGGRIYPLRATLSKLTDQLNPKGFCRIHRSHAVRLDAIDSITPLSSGDSEVKLLSGKVLNLSRRYKDEFKQQLG